MAGASNHRAVFERAKPQFFDGEAEYRIERNGEELLLSLPVVGGAILPTALDNAKSVLDNIDALDEQAQRFLKHQPGWPHRDDVALWLLIVEAGNVRFCYQQSGVNDEQVVGFVLGRDEWAMTGHDPRFRS
jgi:hypothetical protein